MSHLKTVLQLLTRGDKILASSLILISVLSFTVLKAVKEPGQIAVIKVENLQKFSKNLKSGKIEYNETTNTIADGLMSFLGDVNFPIIQKHVERIVRVEEIEIIKAMKLIWER